MNFKIALMQSQISVYMKAAEEIESLLGKDWKVELSKAARAGRFSIKRPLMTATFGNTAVKISTSERGRHLRILGTNGPNYEVIEELANAIKIYIGEDSKFLIEKPVQPITKEKATRSIEQSLSIETSIPSQPLVDNRFPLIKAMDGITISMTDSDEPFELKQARGLSIAQVSGILNKLNSFCVINTIDLQILKELHPKVYEWLSLRLMPSQNQWEAMKEAFEQVLVELEILKGVEAIQPYRIMAQSIEF